MHGGATNMGTHVRTGRGGERERERERKLSSEEVIPLKFHEKRFEWSSVYVLCGFYMNFFKK